MTSADEPRYTDVPTHLEDDATLVSHSILRPRAPPHTVTHYSSRQLQGNQILPQLPPKDREALLALGVRQLAGGLHHRTRRRPFSTAYFPDSGVVSVVSEMTTGHHLAVATVGAEGVLGWGTRDPRTSVRGLGCLRVRRERSTNRQSNPCRTRASKYRNRGSVGIAPSPAGSRLVETA